LKYVKKILSAAFMIIAFAFLMTSCTLASSFADGFLPVKGNDADLALDSALLNLNLEMVKEAVDAGADVTEFTESNILHEWTIAPAKEAMKMSLDSILRYLLEQGSDPS
jgi:hypothetical protein